MVEKVDTWDGIDFAKFGMFLYDKIRVLYGVISRSTHQSVLIKKVILFSNDINAEPAVTAIVLAFTSKKSRAPRQKVFPG